jgi:hypothetical protein
MPCLRPQEGFSHLALPALFKQTSSDPCAFLLCLWVTIS